MKTIKQTIYRSYKTEFEREVTNVFHDLPTWMFPEGFGSNLKNPCPICHQEIGKLTGHGRRVERCSMVQLDNFETMPIHTECYNELIDKI